MDEKWTAEKLFRLLHTAVPIFPVMSGTENQTMRLRICSSCGGDTSAVPVKKRKFAEFLVRIVRCPHCELRKTFLTIRKSGSSYLGEQ